MEPIIRDAEHRLTDATEDTALPMQCPLSRWGLPSVGQEGLSPCVLPSVGHTCSDLVEEGLSSWGFSAVDHTCSDLVEEEYFLSSEKGVPQGTQFIDQVFSLFDEKTNCGHEGSTHSFTRISPVIGAYTNGN